MKTEPIHCPCKMGRGRCLSRSLAACSRESKIADRLRIRFRAVEPRPVFSPRRSRGSRGGTPGQTGLRDYGRGVLPGPRGLPRSSSVSRRPLPSGIRAQAR
jgi:hypothetical protein